MWSRAAPSSTAEFTLKVQLVTVGLLLTCLLINAIFLLAGEA